VVPAEKWGEVLQWCRQLSIRPFLPRDRRECQLARFWSIDVARQHHATGQAPIAALSRFTLEETVMRFRRLDGEARRLLRGRRSWRVRPTRGLGKAKRARRRTTRAKTDHRRHGHTPRWKAAGFVGRADHMHHPWGLAQDPRNANSLALVQLKHSLAPV